MSARSVEIYCPKCEWHPHEADRWSCRCGCFWNTFETNGTCPECGKWWKDTQCLACSKWSPHQDWYHEVIGKTAARSSEKVASACHDPQDREGRDGPPSRPGECVFHRREDLS